MDVSTFLKAFKESGKRQSAHPTDLTEQQSTKPPASLTVEEDVLHSSDEDDGTDDTGGETAPLLHGRQNYRFYRQHGNEKRNQDFAPLKVFATNDASPTTSVGYLQRKMTIGRTLNAGATRRPRSESVNSYWKEILQQRAKSAYVEPVVLPTTTSSISVAETMINVDDLLAEHVEVSAPGAHVGSHSSAVASLEPIVLPPEPPAPVISPPVVLGVRGTEPAESTPDDHHPPQPLQHTNPLEKPKRMNLFLQAQELVNGRRGF